MASSPSVRTKVFVSYSHADKKWLDRLKTHLKPLVREGRLDCWDDTHLRSGDDWKQEIRTALDIAQVAVPLISPGFSASDFIDENELPLADHRFPPEIISHAIWLYFRFPLSLHMVEEMLAARSIVVSHETVRQWALKFGQGFDRATRAEAFETWAEVAGARSAA